MVKNTDRGVWRRLFVGVLVLAAVFLVLAALTKKSTSQEYHWTRTAVDGVARPVDKLAAATLEEEEIISILKRVEDPELNINVVDLGLLQKVSATGASVDIQIILTSPACPYNAVLIENMKKALFAEPKIDEVRLIVALSPPWTPDRMNAEARRRLFGSGPAGIPNKRG